MNKLRIVFIASSGAPNGLYGGSVALLNLLLAIRDRVEVHVIFPDKGELTRILEEHDIKCYYSPKFSLTIYPSIGKDLRSLLEFIPRVLLMLYKRYRAIKYIQKIAIKINADIIHTNVGPLDIGYEVSKKLSIPHVWHLREYQDKDFKMIFFPSRETFRHKLRSDNNTSIAITNDIFSYFEISQDKGRVIYDGIFDEANQHVYQEKEPYYLFTGSLKEAKGFKHLLLAYIDYVNKGGKRNLLVAGAGGTSKFEEECRKLLAESGILGNVRFLGFRNDVYSLMEKASLSIVPSRSEGFGFITAEAMYNHCLVAGLNTGGTKEQFDNGFNATGEEIGLRYESKDQLVDLLKEVESTPINMYNPMIERAYSTVKLEYTIQKCANTVIDLYKEVVSQNQ